MGFLRIGPGGPCTLAADRVAQRVGLGAFITRRQGGGGLLGSGPGGPFGELYYPQAGSTVPRKKPKI